MPDSHSPPPGYETPIVCDGLIEMRDVMVPMRDGKRLAVDIYRPNLDGKFPALLAIAPHNKEYQTPEFAKAVQWAQPAWSRMWFGGAEGGDTDFLVRRGYVHVCGNIRGTGKSDGGGSPEWDMYDLIEWIAKQPWCDGKVGMIGISAFGGAQFEAAAQQPPSLKAIFPYNSMGAYGQWGFRDFYPGGVIHTMVFLLDGGAVYHINRGQPGQLTGEADKLWRAAMSNADLMMYPNIFNVIVEKGQTMPLVYDTVLNPYDADDIVEKTKEKMSRINSVLHRLRLVCVHIQAAFAGQPAMVPGSAGGAEEAAHHRAGASGAAVPFLPRRNPALVRPLAQRQGHRHPR